MASRQQHFLMFQLQWQEKVRKNCPANYQLSHGRERVITCSPCSNLLLLVNCTGMAPGWSMLTTLPMTVSMFLQWTLIIRTDKHPQCYSVKDCQHAPCTTRCPSIYPRWKKGKISPATLQGKVGKVEKVSTSCRFPMMLFGCSLARAN